MQGKLRSLTGPDVVRILNGFGFERVGQRGSHVKLRRIAEAGRRETLHIPLHKTRCGRVRPAQSYARLQNTFPLRS